MLERVKRLIATLKRIAGGMIPSGLLPPTKVVELASTPKVDTFQPRWIGLIGDGPEALAYMTVGVTLMQGSAEFKQLVNTMYTVMTNQGTKIDLRRLTDTFLYSLALGHKHRVTPQEAFNELLQAMKETIVSCRPAHPTVM